MLTNSLKDKSYNIWNERWHKAKDRKGIPEAEQTKTWFPTALMKPELLYLNRMRLGSLIQLTTGHNSLLRHRRYYLGNQELDQTCRLDQAAFLSPFI